MKLGQYRERVTVRARTVTNTGGTPVVTFPTVRAARMSARIDSAATAGAYRVWASQVLAQSSHVVELREDAGVVEGDRIVWHADSGDRHLSVVAVNGLQVAVLEDKSEANV